MKRSLLWLLVAVLVSVAGARSPVRTLFVNAAILTMDENNPRADSIIVRGDRIEWVGRFAQLPKEIDVPPTLIDLEGRTLLPGFVDGHSHFPASGIAAVSVDLSSPPIGHITNTEQLLGALREAAASSKDDLLLGFNYDNAQLAGGQHPTRAQLDRISQDVPIYLWHSSGHMVVANSPALHQLGVHEGSEAPAGGRIGFSPNGRLNGLLQEKAAPSMATLLVDLPVEQLAAILVKAENDYLAAGVTTAQNGHASAQLARVLTLLKRAGLIAPRLMLWPAHTPSFQFTSSSIAKTGNAETGYAGSLPLFTVRNGAVKVIVDGSPQGLTAHLSSPYPSSAGSAPGYQGFSRYTAEELNDLVARYHVRGQQLALHGNGDAAIDLILDAIDLAQQRFGQSDIRHIVVHAQTVREDQLHRMRTLHVAPSFFNVHTYYWGDWHSQKALGPERATRISPMASAMLAGLRFSLHSDTPVTPISPLRSAWSAVTRQTSSGRVLGAHERIDVSAALRALTIDAAWQNHVDDAVGSLVAGKYADFVVLSEDPTQAPDLRDVQVLRTYIGGKPVWSMPGSV